MSTPNEPPKPATADAPVKKLTPEEEAAEKEAERDKAAADQVLQNGIDRPKDRPLVGHVLEQMGTHFSSKAFTAKPGQGLQMAPGDSDSEDDEDIEGESQEDAKKRKEKAKAQRKKGRKDKFKKQQENSQDVYNLYSEDPNQIDLINNLNSIKLLQISEQFEMMPAEAVDLDQFVKIMKEVLKDTILCEREEFISELVDMFYRIVKKVNINVNKEESTTIMFEDLTNYLITHEIAFDADLGTIGALNATNASSFAMEYLESSIKDPTTHNNYIEKIHYFSQIDKVILYEINNQNMRIYNGANMKWEIDVKCPGNILAVEYISDKNNICVSLSDRSFQFFDASSILEKKNKHKFKRFALPSTQKCLCYVQRKRILFSAGTDGMVLAWVIDKIFEQKEQHDDVNGEPADKKKEQEKFREFLCENTPWFLGGAATCIIDLPNIEQIATGSYKKKIELWDLKTESSKNFDMDSEMNALTSNSNDKRKKISKRTTTIALENKAHEEKAKEPLKKLEGHRMAIREIAYSESFKILVSVGFDFKVMVWNPYWKDAIIKLDGHESPLVGVNCPKGLDCFITCDNKGVINVWNIKDYSCLQSFNVAGVNQVTSMRVVPKHRRLIVGSRIFKVYEYKQPFIPTTSNDNQILCALFSDIRFELYLAGANTVMVWNARNGKPVRVFKNCFESDITCMALDKEHRKLILGSSRGEVKVFDVLSGVWIRPYLESHSEENGEISFIAYANEDQNIITSAWDKTIKIHRDDRNDQMQPKQLVMRGLTKAHSKDISCGDYSHQLGLIATGGRDNKTRVWEYEKMKFIDEIISNNNEVAIVKFLNPFSLLLTADNTGWIHIWLINGGHPITKGTVEESMCIVSYQNNHSLKSHSPVTAVDSHYDPVTGEFYLVMGDERGMVKTQDLAIIIQEYNLKPIDVTKNEDGTVNRKRNPWRSIEVQTVTLDAGMSGGDKESEDGSQAAKNEVNEQPISNLKGGDIQSLYPFKAHKDIIKSIKYISATDEHLIFTAGLDKMAYIWGLERSEKGDNYTCRGKLLQGYMMKPNYYWDFPLSRYDSSKEQRKDKIDKQFDEVKRIRKNQKTYKKQAEQVAAKYGNMQSSLGFAATSLLGLDFEDFGTTGFHTKPASYKMQKQVDTQDNLASTFYDDTGRGMKSLQVKKLVEKARKVIARDEKEKMKASKGKMNMTGGKSSMMTAGAMMMQGTAQTKMYQSQMSQGQQSFGNNYTREDLMALEEEEEARQKARKIGPFAFLIDDDIDTEVLTNQQVFDDLKELEDILGQGADTNTSAVVGSKKKR